MTGQAAGERPGPDVQGPRASRRRAIWPLTRVPVAVVGLMVGLIGLTAHSASPRPAPSPGVNSAGTGTPRPGVIVTVAGGVGHGQGTNLGQNPASVAVGRNGDVYSSDDSFNVVRSVNPTSDAEQVDAGNGTKGSAGDRGPATAAQLHGPLGVALDADGNLFIADTAGNRVRLVAATTGTLFGIPMTRGDIYTVAGNGTSGYSGDGGPATSAQLDPQGVAVDANGNLLITGNNRVRLVAATTGTFDGQAMTTGDIYTVAGNGTDGYGGDGGPATAAELSSPAAVVGDDVGNLIIADGFNNRVRVVAATTGTFYAVAMTKGDIYTVAGNGTGGYSGDGGPATSAELQEAQGLAVAAGGNLIIADGNNSSIRVVAAETGTFYGQAMTAGDIYTVAGDGIFGYSGDGGPAISAHLSDPHGVAVDAHGDVVIADTNNNRLRVVAAKTGTYYAIPMTKGDIYTVAGNGTGGYSGDGGPALSAQLQLSFDNIGPAAGGVTIDAARNIVIGDTFDNRIRVVARETEELYGQAMTKGDIYTVAGNGTPGYSGDGGPATSAQVTWPVGVAVDAHGNLIMADSLNGRIRVVAAKSGTYYGQAMSKDDIYTVAGDGTPGYSGDGGPATAAELYIPYGVALDARGGLLIADTATSTVRVVAAQTGTLYGQAMTAGDIYTVAGNGTAGYSGDGGPGTGAQLDGPQAVTLDSDGNVLIADTGNQRVRVVAARTGTFYGQAMTAGGIYTIAGTGTASYSGDGGPAGSADLNFPQGLAVNATGDLLIADQSNNRIRFLISSRWQGGPPSCGLPEGDICTVAGNGTADYEGDGGAATAAELDTPFGVAADPENNVYIVDSASNRIREIGGFGLEIVTTALPPATADRVYRARVHAQGGTAPYTWLVGPGSLPPGLSLETSTGVITGSPTTTGRYSFTVKVTDSGYPPARASARESIAVHRPPPGH